MNNIVFDFPFKIPRGFSKEKFLDAFNESCIDNINDKKNAKNQPKMIISCGQPGTGKTFLLKHVAKEYFYKNDEDIVMVDFDDLRMYHPEYESIIENDVKHGANITSSFTGAVFAGILYHAIKNKQNIVRYAPLMDISFEKHFIKEAKKQGYDIELHTIATPKKLSYANCMLRFERVLELRYENTDETKLYQPRYISKEGHDLLADELVTQLDEIEKTNLIDLNVIWSIRNNEPVYKYSLNDQKNKLSASETLLKTRKSEWTAREKTNLLRKYQTIIKLMKKRSAEQKDINEIEKAYDEAQKWVFKKLEKKISTNQKINDFFENKE